MKQAQYYTHVVERKKEEYEKQKTFYLSFSHELRNLINSLTGNIKLAGLEKLTPRARELFVNAEMCGELLLHLVNNILDTGKAEIGAVTNDDRGKTTR
jgi:signal transduction histidine kinase